MRILDRLLANTKKKKTRLSRAGLREEDVSFVVDMRVKTNDAGLERAYGPSELVITPHGCYVHRNDDLEEILTVPWLQVVRAEANDIELSLAAQKQEGEAMYPRPCT
ncbi:hypothetical protein DIPPA_35893 [Diplonema papillatum]|nr:hypothetical protein DIPPA_35893 [Diplonema papillatum]